MIQDMNLIIPRNVVSDENLTYSDKLIYGIFYTIGCYTNRMTNLNEDNKIISQYLCCDVRTISRALNKLTKYGYVRITYNNVNVRYVDIVQ